MIQMTDSNLSYETNVFLEYFNFIIWNVNSLFCQDLYSKLPALPRAYAEEQNRAGIKDNSNDNYKVRHSK